MAEGSGRRASAAFLAATPAMPVADMARAVAFYRDVLGMTVDHLEPRFAILVRDRVGIHLWGAVDASWQDRADRATRPVVTGAETFIAGTASCRIRVEGLAALAPGFEAAGVVHPKAPLSEKPWGTREIGLLDPDGNLVTLFEPADRAGGG